KAEEEKKQRTGREQGQNKVGTRDESSGRTRIDDGGTRRESAERRKTARRQRDLEVRATPTKSDKQKATSRKRQAEEKRSLRKHRNDEQREGARDKDRLASENGVYLT
ncbi:hypothetical protein TGFOU_294030, partial [Toxoplasma gondii FOU]